MAQRWNPINPRRDIAAFSQSTPGVPGVSEAGDRFGASLEGLLIGAPREDLGDVRDAGVLHVARPLPPLPRVLTLSTGPTASARFGSVTDSVFTPAG
jgi:hypothetical protein